MEFVPPLPAKSAPLALLVDVPPVVVGLVQPAPIVHPVMTCAAPAPETEPTAPAPAET